MKHLTSLIPSLLFAAVLASSQATAGAGGFSGKVVETMNAAGYTYVLVDTGTNKIWAATTQFEIKTNDLVSVPDSMPMNDFHSKSLNRDFPVIYFTGNMTVNGKNTGAAKLPEGHPAIGGNEGAELPANHPPMASQMSPSKPDFTGLKPAPGGKTVAEVYANSAKLSGKSVKIRGKVVKYNADIMGKNWLHIQDGTGKPGSNDLLVTTLGKAKTGDTVLVEGKVATNQDFGAGYKYKVLIADATVTVE